MANKYHFEGDTIVLDSKPRKYKKLTATRFAAVLGLNAWTTPFQVWCAVTKTWEKPFEDSIYTIAGKTIEPKIQQYLDERFFMNVTRPEDVYGKDFFHKTWGDFFHDKKVLGGMWDALGHDDEMDEDFVIEIKTTKRAEDWEDGAPEYYKLQAALYTYLLGLDKFVIPASFLEEADYDDPDAFVPSIENTTIFEYSLAEEYPNFKEDYVDPVLKFWNDHVLTGISPEYDEKADKEPLAALRTNDVKPTGKDITAKFARYEAIQDEMAHFAEVLAPLQAEQKTLKKELTTYMKDKFRDGDDHVEIDGSHYDFNLAYSVRESVDTKRLKEDDLFDEYKKTSDVYTLRLKEKGDK